MKNDMFEVSEKINHVENTFVEKKIEEKRFTALCTNCDERFDCKIRNNSSIIWHCEEYK